MPSSDEEAKALAEMPVAKFVSKHIELQAGKGKTQRQIAQEAGYDKPNMISMFKNGTAKVPLAKIPELAVALDVDPAALLNLVMEQDRPEDFAAMNETFGMVLTKNEREVLDLLRKKSEETGIPIDEVFEGLMASYMKTKKSEP